MSETNETSETKCSICGGTIRPGDKTVEADDGPAHADKDRCIGELAFALMQARIGLRDHDPADTYAAGVEAARGVVLHYRLDVEREALVALIHSVEYPGSADKYRTQAERRAAVAIALAEVGSLIAVLCSETEAVS